MNHEPYNLVRLHESFRFGSYLLLVTSLYIGQIDFFREWNVYIPMFDPYVETLGRLVFLKDIMTSKIVCLVFLVITCIGTRAYKDRNLKVSVIVGQMFSGLLLYWGSWLLAERYAPGYLVASFTGFVVLNICFDNVSKLVNVNLMRDRFNQENESFPQERSYRENTCSVNLPIRFMYRRKMKEGWVNVINPFRGTMVIGTPGSGKSYSVVLPFVKQHLRKGFSMCIYDFKYPDLSLVAYNYFLQARREGALPADTRFYVINFDNICQS